MKKIILFFLGIACYDLVVAQSAAEKNAFLKANIRIWVLHEPNVDTPSFYRVRPSGVFLDTDGIIMGKKTNNGMEASARLLSALFKDPFKRTNGGDDILQELVYQLLTRINKPVDIRFVNDVRQPIDMAYAGKYSYHILERPSGNVIYPAAYKPDSDTSAGDIVLGEKLYPNVKDLKSYKVVLVYLLSKLWLKNYSAATMFRIKDITNSHPPKEMYNDPVLHYIYPNLDTRKSVLDGIAYQFSNYLTINNELLSKSTDNWLSVEPYLLVPLGDASHKVSSMLKDIPPGYILNNQLVKRFSQMKDTGFYLTEPPFDLSEPVDRSWKIYAFNSLPAAQRMQNEHVISLLCSLYENKFFFQGMAEAIILDNYRLLTATPEKKMAVLVENLCQASLGEISLANVKTEDPTQKHHFYGLALVDLLMGFPTDNNQQGSLAIVNESFYGLFPPNSFSQVLLGDYYKLRPQLYEAAQKANKKKDIQPLNSGRKNIEAMANAMWLIVHTQ